MGNDISTPNAGSSSNTTPIAQSFGGVYVPMGGVRLKSEKVGEFAAAKKSAAPSSAQFPQKRTHIVKTAFTGVWSVEQTQSEKSPAERTGQFSAFDAERNEVLVGLGVDASGNYLSDLWVLDVATHAWRPLETRGHAIAPRSGARGAVVADKLFIFGGADDTHYFDDLLMVDIGSGDVQQVATSGPRPSGRSGFAFGAYGNKLFVWGGYNGSCLSELWKLDLSEWRWEGQEKDVNGRTNMAFTVVDNLIYVFGGSKTGGILVINMANDDVSLVPTTGPEPSPMLMDASLVHFDSYLMVIGGKASSPTTFLYGLNLAKMRWFIFHTLPDGTSVSTVDGTISELGMFMLPRTHSMGVIYDKQRREILGFLGQPIDDTANLFILGLGEALSLLHMRNDMFEVVHKG